MTYLYHAVPKNMQGEVLYPLNQLRRLMPEIYEEQAAKYIGRESVMEQRITALDCRWNDVLHFTAVEPEEIYEALRQAGSRETGRRKFYRIEPSLLDPALTVIYRYAHEKGSEAMAAENFAPFSVETLAEYGQLHGVTREYYQRTIAGGDRPLLFHRVPHILYKGSLNITDIPVVEVGTEY